MFHLLIMGIGLVPINCLVLFNKRLKFISLFGARLFFMLRGCPAVGIDRGDFELYKYHRKDNPDDLFGSVKVLLGHAE